jgi:flagellar biosynthesis protein FlhB
MANNDSDRTEEPTAKKLQKARADGQVPRSKDFSNALTGVGAAIIMLIYGDWIIKDVANLTKQIFSFTRVQVFDENFMSLFLVQALKTVVVPFLPFILALMLIGVAAPIIIGGWNFSWKAMRPKLNKFSPLKGFKRMFGVQGLVELLKAMFKFILVALFASAALYLQFKDFLMLGSRDPLVGMAEGLWLIGFLLVIISSSLILIALIDVPYQLWNYNRQQKMTKQEIRDENKDVEGNPQIKQQIRRAQIEMSQRRMMQSVPDADVVITNPEHFSVALKYDQNGIGAPILLAKGTEMVALHIRKIAKGNNIPIVEAPPLARSIYFTTKLNTEIPEGLYVAVAQVLAFVFQLKQNKNGFKDNNVFEQELPIPDDMRY